MALNHFVTPQQDSTDEREHRRQLARAVSGLLAGKRNAMGVLTLTANVTTSTITDSRITPDTVAVLVPTTANAAGAVGGLYQVATAGVLTVHHASTATTDRTFVFILVG